MGTHGPAPKRESQRRRQNVTEPVEHAQSDGALRGPELTGQHSAAAKRWYEALRRSGQAQFFEPSDWAYAAEIVCTAIDAYTKKPSAMMMASINSAMTSLLVSEADRRRVRLELDRAEPEEAPDVSWIDEARRRRDAS